MDVAGLLKGQAAAHGVIAGQRTSDSLRLVAEQQQEYPSLTAACEAVARQVGVSPESARRWVRQAEVDTGQRPGVTSEELEEIKKLKSENRPARAPTCSSIFFGMNNILPTHKNAASNLGRFKAAVQSLHSTRGKPQRQY